MGRRAKAAQHFDVELTDLPRPVRHREFLGRVEAVLFAAPHPVTREALARVVADDFNIDELIDDLRDELKGRAFELTSVAGGWQLRTRKNFADAIRAAAGVPEVQDLSRTEHLVLTAIAYFQPVTRAELTQIFAREISRDVLTKLRGADLVASGARSPRAGAPITYVTTDAYLERFGFNSLRDLPDMDRLEDAGLLSKASLLSGELAEMFGIEASEDESEGLEKIVVAGDVP